jgi:hypothetical protein
MAGNQRVLYLKNTAHKISRRRLRRGVRRWPFRH